VQSLFSGLKHAKLLRSVWFQCLFGAAIFFAAFQVGSGYQKFYSYRVAVEECVTSRIAKDSQLMAKILKQDRWQNIATRLNGIEYTCAFPPDFSQQLIFDTNGFEQAAFFWVVEKGGVDVLRLGKDLLPGPSTQMIVPLSVWDQGDSGDYWVGSISLQIFYGEHLDMIVNQGWQS